MERWSCYSDGVVNRGKTLICKSPGSWNDFIQTVVRMAFKLHQPFKVKIIKVRFRLFSILESKQQQALYFSKVILYPNLTSSWRHLDILHFRWKATKIMTFWKCAFGCTKTKSPQMKQKWIKQIDCAASFCDNTMSETFQVCVRLMTPKITN